MYVDPEKLKVIFSETETEILVSRLQSGELMLDAALLAQNELHMRGVAVSPTEPGIQMKYSQASITTFGFCPACNSRVEYGIQNCENCGLDFSTGIKLLVTPLSNPMMADLPKFNGKTLIWLVVISACAALFLRSYAFLLVIGVLFIAYIVVSEARSWGILNWLVTFTMALIVVSSFGTTARQENDQGFLYLIVGIQALIITLIVRIAVAISRAQGFGIAKKTLALLLLLSGLSALSLCSIMARHGWG